MNSDIFTMEIPSWSEIWPWALLIFGVVWTAYAAIMIGKEKDLYQKYGVIYPLEGFRLKVPHWWSRRENSQPNCHVFERRDTKYNWAAHFEILPKDSEGLDNSARELASLYLRSIGIDLDPNPIEHFGKIPFSQNMVSGMDIEYFSLENTGTQNSVERIYAHVAIIKWKEKNVVMRCLSLSSVLDGCVEGPYFEEVIKNLKFE